MESNEQLKKFRRHVNALAGVYYRLDKGLLTGRNSNGTEGTLAYHYREAARLVAEDARTDDAPLCSYLDNHPKLAAKWNQLERRYVGARV